MCTVEGETFHVVQKEKAKTSKNRVEQLLIKSQRKEDSTGKIGERDERLICSKGDGSREETQRKHR